MVHHARTYGIGSPTHLQFPKETPEVYYITTCDHKTSNQDANRINNSVFPVSLSEVRRVCWRPPCPDSTAPSPSFTRTSSCRGSRPQLRPLPLQLHPPPSTSTSPPPPPPPPHPPTQPPTANLTSWRSILPRRTHPTPTQLCPPTPTRHRRLSTPTPTQRHSGHGSSYVFHFPCPEAELKRGCRNGDAASVEAPPVTACLLNFSCILDSTRTEHWNSPSSLLNCCCCCRTLHERSSLEKVMRSFSRQKLQETPVAGQTREQRMFDLKVWRLWKNNLQWRFVKECGRHSLGSSNLFKILFK